jgi:hypothetical protein
MADAAKPKTGSRDRSPSYPGIPLGTAIQRAQTVYDKEHRNQAPMATLTKHWGYKTPITGPATVTYSALKKFGLLEEEGRGTTRQAKLTPLALDILLKPEHDAEVQKAALLPKIHRELWDQYGSELPSDETLMHVLITQRAFTDSGARDFLREYRSTIAFAGLDSAGTVVDEAEDEEEGGPDHDEGHGKHSPKPKRPGMMNITVPVPGGDPIYVEGKFPVPEPMWDQFMAVLAAMKPGLVEPDPYLGHDSDPAVFDADPPEIADDE